ncbi:glycosyltransferase family 4 protein [Longimicrobium terrae]|uniref:Glycosyltransferase involved in cell wall biosynthesis n=1 Tax=Longimicrobium terrae TaxID=1639882 RepID=A0A841GYH1_9BACT|nr:glycosyltransferase family 4 protein [Longimicrobium terrae]MBB4636651.1 glycosyltransferase involved in cell wall biosynthesis [Longimicrobium terrae]MBB6070825.1 glycosyltransferase involved in cell wall biosynthesis [Longimicrobium terrae]NNC28851.1 glycosyltransferase family 4 protein [Longimicrobium terrae]
MHPHVCLITDSLEPSGVGRHMLTLARALRRTHRVSLVCPPSAEGDRLLARAAAAGINAAAITVRAAWDEQPFAEWMRSNDVGLLHVHAGVGWEGHHAVYTGPLAGIPVIRTEHLPYVITDDKQRGEHAAVAARCARIICVSRAARDSYAAAGFPPRVLRVVHNGIARPRPPRRSADEMRAELDLPADARILLTVARFTEQKGHAHLMDAVPAIMAAEPRARFVWVGDGPLRASMEESARRMGISDAVRITGSRDDVPELMGAAELCILPSLFEGLPLVALEAMAAGVPVIGTDVCGTAEAVREGRTGRLVPAGDASALARAIGGALADPAALARWSRAGRARVRGRFTAERMAARTAIIYRAALAEHAPLAGRA